MMRKPTLSVDWGQGRTDRPRSTVPVLAPSELASPEAKARLFAALEKFANLDDTLEAYQGFLSQSPAFWPASIRQVQEDKPVDWSTPECHRLALVYRDALRRVWRNEQKALSVGLAGFILGIDDFLGGAMNGDGVPHIPGLNQACSRLVVRYPKFLIEVPNLFAHWGSGAFLFNPLTDFQKAVYILFRESWRAKVCPCCSGFFIAHKPPQIYCSSRCYGTAKQRRGLDWWREHGSQWRAARKAKQVGRKSQRKGRGK